MNISSKIIVFSICILFVFSCKPYKYTRYKPKPIQTSEKMLPLLPILSSNIKAMHSDREDIIKDIKKLHIESLQNFSNTTSDENNGYYVFILKKYTTIEPEYIFPINPFNLLYLTGIPSSAAKTAINADFVVYDAKKNKIATYNVDIPLNKTKAWVGMYVSYSRKNAVKASALKAHKLAIEEFQKQVSKDIEIINGKLKSSGVVKIVKSDVIGNTDDDDYTIFNNSINEKGNSAENSGTGFLISSTKGIVVTNFHVVDGAKQVRVTFNSGTETKSYWANVINEDKVNNIAVLKIDDDFVSPGQLPYSVSDDYNIKEPVFTCAFTQNGDSVTGFNSTTGEISELVGFENNQTLMQITANVIPGNSGGPLFNNKGQVIGMCTGTDNPFFYDKYQNKIPKDVNYAVKSDYILPLIKEYKDKNAPVQNNLPQSEQLKSIQKFICKIKVN